MAEVTKIHVQRVTADDKVTLDTLEIEAGEFTILNLPGNVYLFFDGFGAECEANLLGFLDRMHAIRNAVLQDRVERTRDGAESSNGFAIEDLCDADD